MKLYHKNTKNVLLFIIYNYIARSRILVRARTHTNPSANRTAVVLAYHIIIIIIRARNGKPSYTTDTDGVL